MAYFENSGKVIMFFFVLIHLHLVLITANNFHSKNFDTCTSNHITKSTPKSSCPFKATKAFFNRQTAFIYSAFNPTLGKQNTKELSPIKPEAQQAFSFLTSKDVLKFVDLRKHSRKNFQLFSAVDERISESKIEEKKNDKKKGGASDNMEVIVIGLSHHNAGVDVREKLAIPEDEWNNASAALCEYPSIKEASVLSTCNRFELYLAGPNQYELAKDTIDYLEKRAKGALSQEILRQNLFILSGEDAIWHLLRVSAGLDSLVVGEGQILAQVKRSYERGIEDTGCAGKVVSRMLNVAVSAGKRVRSETGISKGAVSISSAAAEFTATKLAKDCKVQDMEKARIAIIGAGKMARLLLVHLQTQGVTKVTVVNRSFPRVEELQKEFPDIEIDFKLMESMWDVIANSDVVYPSTAATTTIIDPEPLRDCMTNRDPAKGGIMFVDISVPRNVHPDCNEINGAYCYNVDNLKEVVERNTARRRREMIEAEVILKEELAKFRLWQQSLGAIPTIARLQEKAELLRLEELQKASKKLSNLTKKDLDAVDRLSKGIVAKLLHGPMSHLRQQKEGDDTRAAIEQVQRAFNLDA